MAADVVTLSTTQHDGTFSFTGADSTTASGYYTLKAGNAIQSLSGTVTGLGTFAGTLNNASPAALEFKLEPTTLAKADDLATAVGAIVTAIEALFT